MLAIIPDWWLSNWTFPKEVVTLPSILSAPAVPDSLWQPVEEGSTPSDCLVLWNSSLAVNAGTLFLISVSEFLNFSKLFLYFLFQIFVRWCDTSFHWCVNGIWCDCLGLDTSQSQFSSLVTVSFQTLQLDVTSSIFKRGNRRGRGNLPLRTFHTLMPVVNLEKQFYSWSLPCLLAALFVTLI